MLSYDEMTKVRAIKAHYKTATAAEKQYVVDLMAREMKTEPTMVTSKTLSVMRKAKLAGFVPRNKS